MSKHTPSPWKLYATPNDTDFTYEIDGIACIYAGNGNSESNARLITAAPELLEALQDLMLGLRVIRGIDIEDYCSKECKSAYAAIAKATGEV